MVEQCPDNLLKYYYFLNEKFEDIYIDNVISYKV